MNNVSKIKCFDHKKGLGGHFLDFLNRDLCFREENHLNTKCFSVLILLIYG